MAMFNPCTFLTAKDDSVPRIDSAIELTNLLRAEEDARRCYGTSVGNTTPETTATQVSIQQQQATQLQNIHRKLADHAARQKDADLSIRRMLSQGKSSSPQALTTMEQALDNAMLATSNLMKSALQT
ncbi:MAG: hypothetical protein Q9168_003919, partial [Polycauliona sp. 1 TL-2023]